MFKAPEEDGDGSHDADKDLGAGDGVLGRADGRDGGGVGRGLVDPEESSPDSEIADQADRKSDGEPFEPAGGRVHVLNGNDILGRTDRRGHTTDIRGQGNTENKAF